MTRSVYIAEDGGTLRRDGETLQVWVKGERRAAVPLFDVGQVVLLGNLVITPGVVALLLDRGIDVVILSRYGRYLGRITSGVSSNVRLRTKQVRVLDDPAFTLRTASIVVDGKIANQRVLLRRHGRRHGFTEAMRKADVALRAARARLSMCTTLDEVRGCEGSAAAAYFRAFGDLVRGEGFRFAGRTRRPPMDPVNALLSLGYTLLANAIESAVHVVGLDPYVGALHAPLAGRPSLVCDLQEELRAACVDPLVLAAINQGALRPEDFEQPTPDDGVTMTREGLRAFVQMFERRMRRPTHYAPQGRALPWRSVVLEQARAFARHVLGEETYVPYAMR